MPMIFLDIKNRKTFNIHLNLPPLTNGSDERTRFNKHLKDFIYSICNDIVRDNEFDLMKNSNDILL
jgi:hypothetical protein